eukprot:755142-Hanusia_phi.AAC.12
MAAENKLRDAERKSRVREKDKAEQGELKDKLELYATIHRIDLSKLQFSSDLNTEDELSAFLGEPPSTSQGRKKKLRMQSRSVTPGLFSRPPPSTDVDQKRSQSAQPGGNWSGGPGETSTTPGEQVTPPPNLLISLLVLVFPLLISLLVPSNIPPSCAGVGEDGGGGRERGGAEGQGGAAAGEADRRGEVEGKRAGQSRCTGRAARGERQADLYATGSLLTCPLPPPLLSSLSALDAEKETKKKKKKSERLRDLEGQVRRGKGRGEERRGKERKARL